MLEASEGRRRVSLLADRARSTLDAVLCTRPENIYYFTGFRTTLYTRFTAALVRMDRPGSPVLIVATVDRRMIEDRVWSPPWVSHIAYHGPDGLPDVAASPAAALMPHLTGIRRLGVDSLQLTEVDVINQAAPGIELVQSVGLLDDNKRTKADQEIAWLRQANQIAMQGIENARDMLEAGSVTELGIAVNLEATARLGGADGFGYPTLVSCGVKITAIHSPALPRPVEPHQPVRIAFGPTVEGYTADVVRTLCIGDPPAELVRLQDGFLVAQDTLFKMIRPGVKASAMLAAVEEIYIRLGLHSLWNNTIGHSVGLTVHETPRIVAGVEVVLSEGMVLAVEPGLIVPGFGGFWHCDVVVVQESGLELLTQGLRGIVVASKN